MEGNDTLTGGAGNDTLEGVYGPDDYVFSAAAVNGRDTIVGFSAGLDRLVFTGVDYGFASGHVLTAAEFTVGAAAAGSNAQFVWNDVTSRLYWDADGTGAGAAIELALIGNGAMVTKDDLFFT
jgi:Ca2+-binding RTX toxin-like protein